MASSDDAPSRDGDRSQPTAVIHKRILDVAERRPDASLERIASEVSGASVDLVEQVLDEYGDPAESPPADGAESATESGAEPGSESESEPDHAAESAGSATDGDDGTRPADRAADQEAPGSGTPEPGGDAADPEGSAPEDDPELSPEQRETLREVAADPTATQKEIGDRLGVTRATVSRRLNSVEGFDWQQREAFVADRFGTPAEPDRLRGEPRADGDRPEGAAELADRVEALEARVDERDDAPLSDPELAHKVIHACMDADRITEDEELRIIRELLGPGGDRE